MPFFVPWGFRLPGGSTPPRVHAAWRGLDHETRPAATKAPAAPVAGICPACRGLGHPPGQELLCGVCYGRGSPPPAGVAP